MSDKNTHAICAKLKQRAAFGEQKYGTTMDRSDLSPSEWVQHHQEELMDALQYSERMDMAAMLVEEARAIMEGITTCEHAKVWREIYDEHFRKSNNANENENENENEN